MPDLETLRIFATSLAVGLLMGLERERAPSAKAGLRTFALVALTGTVCALLSQQAGQPWLLAAGALIVGAMMIGAYATGPSPEDDPGTTTTIAAVLCYGLGAMLWYGHAQLVVALALTATMLLYFRTELHGWSRNLTRQDMVSLLQFAVISLIVLPVLPNRGLGPYDALNPYHIWLMVVLISGVSLAGYAALRIVGQRHGAPLVGLLGGVASSTATTIVFARHVRARSVPLPVGVVAILLANLVVLARIALVTAVAGPALLPSLGPVLALGLAAGSLVPVLAWRRLAQSDAAPALEVANPTELRTALLFAALFAVILVASEWMHAEAGALGIYGVAVVSGLTDLDAITLSTLRLTGLGQVGMPQAVTAIVLAYTANGAFKLGTVFFLGSRELAIRVAAGYFTVLAGLGAGWLFFLP